MLLSGACFLVAVGGLYYITVSGGSLPEPLEGSIGRSSKWLESTDSEEKAQDLIEHVKRLKEKWASGEAHDALVEELNDIKEQLNQYQDESSPSYQEKINSLMEKVENLIGGIKEKVSNIDDQFDSLEHDLQWLRGKKSETNDSTSTSEEDKDENPEDTE
jgi:chromosome segregation ATPase